MRRLRVESTWRAFVDVEVDDETAEALLADCSTLEPFPADVLEQMTPTGAELVDWDVSE